ncbi:bile acid:sodium symporter family protein [Antarcticibacterium flavum]|uniref:Bile acid:sodium symporter family protein n=1 Tax=Antarcticibacterium flavum TaxID=2058175 RepID=A0A5B7X3A6_9FLAO|nr:MULTISPECIES: bile acid:sodium symporter family protein [Antarcticibacterium]MCM4159146.1 bile acid:sodium symporter [Antarcticibacterium sp. W02-3]QCY69545.1 bile acid:sodium symporter family protein [Antarcticibacterium flavum]
MEANLLTQVFLPLALFIIMLGMGLTLKPADFRNVVLFPKAVGVGLVLKLIFIPALTFGMLYLIPLQPELAVGFVLLVACPGGATTNLITHLAQGDVALSITLTAIASVITVFTIPILVDIGMLQFMGEGQMIELPFFRTIIQILIITILPVGIGMILHKRSPRLSHKAEKPVKILSAIFLVLIIASVLIKERANLVEFFLKAGPLSLLLNLLGMLIGYYITKAITKNKAQSLAVGIEVGIVNGTLGIAIAAGILENSVMTIPSAIYSIIMFPGAMLLVYLGNKKNRVQGIRKTPG